MIRILLLDIALYIMENGDPQVIANIATAYSSLGVVDHANYFSALSDKKVCQFITKNGDPQNIANIATAYSSLGVVDHANYFSALSDKKVCQKIMKGGDPQAIANITSAYANLGIDDNCNFFLALSDNMSVVNEGDSQNNCNCLWSFAFLGLLDNKVYESIIKSLWKKAMSMPVSDFTVEGLNQLRQIYTCSIIEGGNKLDEIPSALRSKINAVENDKIGSKAHNDISRLLNDIGFEHQNEVSPFVDDIESGFSGGDEFMAIDMANLKDRIAIELDGPSHFIGLGKDGRVETVKTKMKSRILERLGWKVIKIPWFEWKEFNGEEKHDKVEYLKGVLLKVEE